MRAKYRENSGADDGRERPAQKNMSFNVTIPEVTQSALLRALSAVGAIDYEPGFRQNVPSIAWMAMQIPEGDFQFRRKRIAWETLDGVKTARVWVQDD